MGSVICKSGTCGDSTVTVWDSFLLHSVVADTSCLLAVQWGGIWRGESFYRYRVLVGSCSLVVARCSGGVYSEACFSCVPGSRTLPNKARGMVCPVGREESSTPQRSRCVVSCARGAMEFE